MKHLFLLAIVFNFFVDIVFAQSPNTVILQNNRSNKKIFNGNLDGEEIFLFRKKQLENEGITEKLDIKYPAHIYFSNLVIDQTGSKNMNYGSLIVFPGDSVSIIGDQLYSKLGFTEFIDRLLLLQEEDYELTEKWFLEKLKNKSIANLVDDFNKEYKNREQKIYSNAQKFGNDKLKVLDIFNILIKYKKFASIPFEKITLSPQDKITLDSIYREIDLTKIATINSPFKMAIYYSVIKYNAYVNQKINTDFWDNAFNVDMKVQRQDFFVPYLLSVYKLTSNNNAKILDEILIKLNEKKSKSEKLYEFQSTLLAVKKSKSDYKGGKEDLKGIKDGRYNFLLGNTNKDIVYRDIKSLSLDLEDSNGLKKDFQEVILKAGKKLTVIDFWASWCIPCIQEHPFLLKVKNKFKNQPIHFVNISIDKEIDKKEWIKMALKINNSRLIDQYIVPDQFKTALKKFFNLSTIPRYVLINQKGEILNYDFDRPSNANFENNLNNFLMKPF